MAMAETWLRVRELFEQALHIEPGAVSAWLGEVEPNPEIRAEVLSLIGNHSHAGSFLDQPIAARAPDLLDLDAPLVAGQSVGPYTIVREIGRGGMGHVYLATDSRLGRTVALKALPQALVGSPSQRERLRREARAAAQLSHPGICTVYALEEVDGALYIASEFVDGHTLREEIRSGSRPSSEEVRQTAVEIAQALAGAHARGITHRDLKPDNIMRTADGRVKLVDFGLAIVDPAFEATIEGRLTQSGMLVGTPAYMAPEQLNGQPADFRSDVFAYGVVIHEFACGRHPFEAPTGLAMAARVLEGGASGLDVQRPDLPAGLSLVVARCLRRVPAERFASGAEILTALAVASPSQPSPRPGGRVTGWWRRHQLTAIGLYFLASIVAWQIKEWQPGITSTLFLAVGALATVGGMFRGHLIFTQQMNPPAFAMERRRAGPVTAVVDVAIAMGLAVSGLLVAAERPLAAVLTIGLAVGIALARLLVEPTTTTAAFEPPSPGTSLQPPASGLHPPPSP
jgi:serine/threonine protein kinase